MFIHKCYIQKMYSIHKIQLTSATGDFLVAASKMARRDCKEGGGGGGEGQGCKKKLYVNDQAPPVYLAITKTPLLKTSKSVTTLL